MTRMVIVVNAIFLKSVNVMQHNAFIPLFITNMDMTGYLFFIVWLLLFASDVTCSLSLADWQLTRPDARHRVLEIPLRPPVSRTLSAD